MDYLIAEWLDELGLVGKVYYRLGEEVCRRVDRSK
jgi:hypothetical protein